MATQRWNYMERKVEKKILIKNLHKKEAKVWVVGIIFL